MRYKFIFVLLLFLLQLAGQNIVTAQMVVRDTSYTVYSSFVKEKKKRPYIQIVKPSLDGLTVWENVDYKKINKYRSLKLNIYRPDSSRRKLPAVIMIHGGGWNSGDLSMQIPLAANIARQGFVCIPVEYRLIPEALYPAGVRDLEDVVKWVYKNAGKYGIDKSKIAVSGCSAGGQLAGLLGAENKDGIIRAVVNIDGISTFMEESNVERAQKARDTNGKMPVDAIWLGGTYKEKPDHWEQASALSHVTAKSAPVCFINSSIPRFHNGRDEMIVKLNKLHIYSEVHEIEDTPHTFWLFYPWHEQAVNYAVAFLQKILVENK